MKKRGRSRKRWLAALLVAASWPGLYAQSTSPLDTAPGVNAATGTNVSSAVAPGVTAAADGTELFAKEDLQSADWDKSLLPGVTWMTEGGKTFGRLVSPQPAEQVELYRVIDLPPGVTALEVSARYRTAGLKAGREPEDTARTILEILDKSSKPIRAAPPLIFSDQAADWTTITERFALPPNAVYLAVRPCLFRVAAGTLDLAAFHVVTLGVTDATRLAAQADADAVKKLADQNAILNRELALPPKTLELKTSGNKLVTAEGREVWLQGVNVPNLAVTADEDQRVLWSIHVALEDWNANVIRLPVQDSFWFGRGRGNQLSNDAQAYRETVDKAVKLAGAKGAYIVLDLHRFLTPDASCVAFWQDAAARYKNNPAVLFDIFNEPHDTSWDIWQKGGLVNVKEKGGVSRPVQGVGMQGLVDAVRGTGAKNLIVAGGLGYAFDLTGVVNGYALDDKGGNGIMYATHFYNWAKGWESHFMAVAAKYPLLVGECGADIVKMNFVPAKDQEDPYTWSPDAIGFIQKNHLNWTAWCLHTRANPNLLLDWDYYTPTPYWGAFVKDALHGTIYEMKRER